MLKIDLHCHTNLDPKDGKAGRGIVTHSADDLFEKAANEGFDAIALTHHIKYVNTQEIRDAAKKHGVLYIPGVEVEINGIHVLLLNPPHDDVKTFSQLEKLRLKHPEMLVVAPHPFYPGRICLRKNLEKYIHLFDAIEFAHLYTKWYNKPNERAVKIARKYNLALVGNSDVHYLHHFGTTYSHVAATELSIPAIFEGIRNNHCICISEPLSSKAIVKATLPFAKRIPMMLAGK